MYKKEGIYNQSSFFDIFNKLSDLKRKIIVSGLNKLQKEDKILFTSNYIICFNNGEIREAEEKEIELINKIENDFLKENDLTKNKLMYNDKMKKELYWEIDSALFELVGDEFKMCYQAFIIMNVNSTLTEAKEELEKFNGWGRTTFRLETIQIKYIRRHLFRRCERYYKYTCRWK